MRGGKDVMGMCGWGENVMGMSVGGECDGDVCGGRM